MSPLCKHTVKGKIRRTYVDGKKHLSSVYSTRLFPDHKGKMSTPSNLLLSLDIPPCVVSTISLYTGSGKSEVWCPVGDGTVRDVDLYVFGVKDECQVGFHG